MSPASTVIADARMKLTSGRVDEAIALLREQLAQNPSDPLLAHELGGALMAAGKPSEALSPLVAAAGLAPNVATFHYALGVAREAAGDRITAIDDFKKAIELDPRAPEPRVSLANIYKSMGRFKEAARILEEGLALSPGIPSLIGNLAYMEQEMGLIDSAIDRLKTLVELHPRNRLAWHMLLFALNYSHLIPPEQVTEYSARFGKMSLEVIGSGEHEFDNDRDPRRRLRVGYLSGDLIDHSVSFYIESLLEHHDPAAVEVFCYSAHNKPGDPVQERLQSRRLVWRDVSAMGTAAMVQRMRADKLDVLIELSGHTAKSRLAALANRAAPIQISYLGYPATTGMPAIDYRIVDAFTDPPGAERLSTEKLLRIDPCFLCYRPFADAPPPAQAPSVIDPARPPVFGSFNTSRKITTDVIQTWADLLQSIPGSSLILKTFALGSEDGSAFFRSEFTKRGITPDRLTLLGGVPSRADHLAMYSKIDVGLDTFPYAGTTTTCEAMWMGVPVVTLAGAAHAGRVGVSLSHAAGLDELVAPDRAAYVRIARELALDKPRLSALRSGMRERLARSVLCDGPRFAKAFEAKLREAWTTWCATPPKARSAAPAAAAPAAAGPDVSHLIRLARDAARKNDIKRARTLLTEATETNPHHTESFVLLGNLLMHFADAAAAIKPLSRAVELEPSSAAWRVELGNALTDAGRLAEAREQYQAACALDRGNYDARLNLADVAVRSGDYTTAISAAREAASLRPDMFQPGVNAAAALINSGRVAEGVAALRELRARFATAYTLMAATLPNLAYLPESTPESIRAAHEEYTTILRTFDPPDARPFQNKKAPDRRLKIAYMSPDLRAHSVAFFVEPLLEQRDRAGFHVTCYDTTAKPDAVTKRLRGKSDAWVEAKPLDDAALAERIRQDQIDILIDLAGFTLGDRTGVLSRRPAPLIMTAIGYPATTGLSGVYRLVDAITDPPGVADAWHSETLVRLARCFLCYRPPSGSDCPPVSSRAAGPISFGSFNAMPKISAPTLDAWAAILRQIPGSTLTIKNRALRDPAVRSRLGDELEARGIDPDRLTCLPPADTLADHLAQYGSIDIALDTMPYCGATTTCEALWMGVPVVTAAGVFHPGRVGASLLSAAGLSDLVGADADDMVRRAVALAADGPRLAELRRTLRDRVKSSPLCDAKGYTKAVEAELRTLWRTWCSSL